MTDSSNLNRLMEQIGPDEVYNLAAQSHVKVSFDVPEYTAEVDAIGTLRFLDAIKEVGLKDKTRFYQASTSELFGKAQESPQNEHTPFYPRSPYAAAKLYAYWIVVNYREAFGLHASNGIFFNHESPRRGETFVTRKITRAVGRIAIGEQAKLVLGNLDASRDWGFTPEYTEGMQMMLQQDQPGDYVLATNQTTTVRDFVRMAFGHAGLEIEFQGEGVEEKGIDPSSGNVLVEVSPNYFRPTEVDALVGDYSKAKEMLGWEPKTKVEELCRIMVESDLDLAKHEKAVASL